LPSKKERKNKKNGFRARWDLKGRASRSIAADVLRKKSNVMTRGAISALKAR